MHRPDFCADQFFGERARDGMKSLRVSDEEACVGRGCTTDQCRGLAPRCGDRFFDEHVSSFDERPRCRLAMTFDGVRNDDDVARIDEGILTHETLQKHRDRIDARIVSTDHLELAIERREDACMPRPHHPVADDADSESSHRLSERWSRMKDAICTQIGPLVSGVKS